MSAQRGSWRPDHPLVAASRTIFIAGAGIGGLTASLTLAARGFRVVVLEKAERLEETGAGLQLSPNASHMLASLGLKERLGSRAVTPEAICIMSARAGGEIARLPLGEAAATRAGAPYWVVHRADLQAALAAAVNDHPDIELQTRLHVRGRDLACQGHDRGPAQRQFAAAGSRDGADRCRRHLVQRPASSVPGGAAAILRPDRLARHARCHAIAARIHRAAGAALDGTGRAYRRLSDLGRAPDQCRGDRAGHLEPAGLERARRWAGIEGRVRCAALAGSGADDARRGRRLAQMGAVHPARTAANGPAAPLRSWATPRMPCCRLRPRAPAWRSRMPRCWRKP